MENTKSVGAINWILLFSDIATVMGTIINDLLNAGILHPTPDQIVQQGLKVLGKTFDDYKHG